MKQLIIALALLIPPSFVSADEGAQWDDPCALLGGLAKEVMDARQAGTPMSALMQQFTKALPGLSEAHKSFLISAYEEPQWNSEAKRADAANRFRNEFELKCYKEQ